MAQPICQKTFKIELEFSVAMEEVGEQHLSQCDEVLSLPYLQRLQLAMVKHETALLRQMVGSTLNQLQHYSDYLAAQDDLSALLESAATLKPEDREFFDESREEFADLTRPIRLSCLSVQMNRSTISEQITSDSGETSSLPVWTDLRPGTELGKQMESLAIPTAPVETTLNQEAAHHLLVRYLSRQRDGVHLEGRCTCHSVIQGVGESEGQALDDLWRHHNKHLEVCGTADRIERGLKELFSKN